MLLFIVENIAKPLKPEDRERDKERERDEREKDREKEREKEREKVDKGAPQHSKDGASHRTPLFAGKEKYNLFKPISELDFSNCQRCTPSYRLLPKNVSLSKLVPYVVSYKVVKMHSSYLNYSKVPKLQKL